MYPYEERQNAEPIGVICWVGFAYSSTINNICVRYFGFDNIVDYYNIYLGAHNYDVVNVSLMEPYVLRNSTMWPGGSKTDTQKHAIAEKILKDYTKTFSINPHNQFIFPEIAQLINALHYTTPQDAHDPKFWFCSDWEG